ncbi:uncharacterized protein LOC109790970 [Cajanus cajan]|uniref:uncharacterized protein LOC109790970 n=1 Tax=Cajanus cajan TaxID=3821 RepID=UPI00098D876B|nr:uncharacterized protein LOC109790970 [Cajanus cajan]
MSSKRQSHASKGKQVDNTGSNERGTEEEDGELELELEKEDLVSVTRHLCIKPVQNSQKLDKEAVLRRIRHRKRMNKLRSTVEAFLFSTDTRDIDASLQGKRWVDDAFAAL